MNNRYAIDQFGFQRLVHRKNQVNGQAARPRQMETHLTYTFRLLGGNIHEVQATDETSARAMLRAELGSLREKNAKVVSAE